MPEAAPITGEQVLTEYAPGGPLHAWVKQAGQTGVTELELLGARVALAVFKMLLEPKELTKRLISFWEDLPPEQQMLFYAQLNAVMKANGTPRENIEYTMRLTQALMEVPDKRWDQLNANLVRLFELTGPTFKQERDVRHARAQEQIKYVQG